MEFTKTSDEWMTAMADRSLEWLLKQRHPCVRGRNGRAHDEAIDALISKRTAAGEQVPRRFVPVVLVEADPTDAYDVEIVEYGGRGGTMRVVRPRP